MGAIITLTTDFGLADGYVAAMKGVLLSVHPQATLVDVCHGIAPGDIPQAAFVLSTVWYCFPARTVHLVVVDPGVGTDRRAVILRTPRADYVAPDNGVLSYVIEPHAAAMPENGGLARLEEEATAVAITNPDFWRQPVSPTFHGRDVFAPVAGLLSRGVDPSDFGDPVDSLTVLPLTRPRRHPDGSLTGHVRHVDNFGNLVTDIHGEDLPPARLAFSIGGRVIDGLTITYGTGRGLLAVIGSSGCLEIALRDGSAAAMLGVAVGAEVAVSEASAG